MADYRTLQTKEIDMTKVTLRTGFNSETHNDLVRLAKESAHEVGAIDIFDEEHCRNHFKELMESGVFFLLSDGDDIIGAALFTQIDAGFATLKHFESQHIFVEARRRAMPLLRQLIEAIQQYARDNQVVMLVHQVAYFDALEGNKKQTKRVENLYRHFDMDGSFGITYAIRPEMR